MFEVVLYQPEIPPNTGNIIRLCANTGCRLHLVRPLAFRLSDRALRRAGLDYDSLADVVDHRDWDSCCEYLSGRRRFAFTTRATLWYAAAEYREGDVMVFGPETRGLPLEILQTIGSDRCLRLPMRPESRSANLANAVAVVIYEAWRQLGFRGAT